MGSLERPGLPGLHLFLIYSCQEKARLKTGAFLFKQEWEKGVYIQSTDMLASR